MIKVYLKGFKKPISVVGEPLFEDERFYAVRNEGIRRKILWENILYIEEFEQQTIDHQPSQSREDVLKDLIRQAAAKKSVSQDAQKASAPAKPNVGPGFKGFVSNEIQRVTQIEPEEDLNYDRTDLADISVIFSGHKNETMSVKVPRQTLNGTYNPNLAREIFSNTQVQAMMGDFIISGVPKVESQNVYFETKSIVNVKEKLDNVNAMFGSVAKAASNVAKLENRPTLSLDDSFSMPGSTFDKPVQFSA